MKYIELFAGIGGFRLGLEATGHECVWSNEGEERPRHIYHYNFGDYPDERDIRDVCGRDLPEADLLVGGFPCATFSYAGSRSGLSSDDTRGTLCFEMFRILRERRIPYMLFENVKGLLSNDNGRAFGTIIHTLDEMGYDVQWELLDTQNFGIPQHRERVFLVANLRGKPRPKVFPIGETAGKDGDGKEGQEGFFSVHKRAYGGLRNHGGESPTLTANMGTGGNNVPFVKMTMLAHTQSNIKERTQDREATWTLDTTSSKMAIHEKEYKYDRKALNELLAKADLAEDDIKALDLYNKKAKDICPTLTLPHHNALRLYEKSRLRKLTPIECERLQGLPDDFTKWLKDKDGNVKENSDSDRYERCGRTVTSTVIEAIGRKLGYEWWD